MCKPTFIFLNKYKILRFGIGINLDKLFFFNKKKPFKFIKLKGLKLFFLIRRSCSFQNFDI